MTDEMKVYVRGKVRIIKTTLITPIAMITALQDTNLVSYIQVFPYRFVASFFCAPCGCGFLSLEKMMHHVEKMMSIGMIMPIIM